MKKNNFLIIIFSLLVLVLPQLTLAIGQMTKPIVFENVLRDQEVEETLILYGEEKEVIYGLIAEGEIKDWATFFTMDNLPIKEIKVPAKSQMKTLVKFKVPKDTPNGTYTGEVAILTIPGKEEKKEGVSTSVGLRIGREVSIIVTDKEIIKFETTIIPLKYGVKKGEPLKIKAIYENQGNVSIKPAIQLKILKGGGVIFNAIFPYPEGKEPIKPLERKEFPDLIEWQTAGQASGEYKAEIKVLLNDKTYKEESFRFTVGSEAFDFKKLLAVVAFLGAGNLMLGWFVLGGIFLVAAAILFFVKKIVKTPKEPKL